MVNSMTGFAALTGQTNDQSWVLEIKSVNARGLDIRQRISEGGDVLEPLFKAEISKIASRGSVNVFLRTETKSNSIAPILNQVALDAAISALGVVQNAADGKGLELSPTSGADLLALRGVFEHSAVQADTSELVSAVKREMPKIVKDFANSRASEGAALQKVLAGQIETVGTLTAQAAGAAGERKAYVAARLAENLDLLMSETDGVDAARLEQELALLAVKSDITEEIDRLAAHVDAARELLATKGPIGRKFDFLMQEFNREANTLCSKSGSTELTRIGLELKTVIDQMREQVQNVE